MASSGVAPPRARRAALDAAGRARASRRAWAWSPRETRRSRGVSRMAKVECAIFRAHACMIRDYPHTSRDTSCDDTRHAPTPTQPHDTGDTRHARRPRPSRRVPVGVRVGCGLCVWRTKRNIAWRTLGDVYSFVRCSSTRALQRVRSGSGPDAGRRRRSWLDRRATARSVASTVVHVAARGRASRGWATVKTQDLPRQLMLNHAICAREIQWLPFSTITQPMNTSTLFSSQKSKMASLPAPGWMNTFLMPRAAACSICLRPST